MLNQTFDVSRITNLENRLTADEALMLTNNDTARQNVPYLNVNGTTNALVSIVDPAANGCWWGIMQDPTLYNLAIGRFATGSKAIEIRAYFDNLTIRTGRSGTATSADFNLITNDQAVAGISANANLMPRGVLNLCPNNGGLNTNGVSVILNGAGQPVLKSINTAIANSALKMGSAGLYVRDSGDVNYTPIYSSAFNVASDVTFKTDVKDYEESALDHVNKTKVRKYKLKNEDPKNPDRIGLIRDEAPEQLQAEDNTLDLYQLCSMLWKAVQELSAEVSTLKGAAANG
jgi:hypothetical protein